ncbi:hypothetical protein, partial [Photobacterium alginatilyticum]|uniref:hypothetical protein n=1 Tax=Photobacterium alginatilyticum TaxID=1775171 RepID=UPI001963F2CF
LFRWFPGKLRSQWVGPFIIANIYPHYAVETRSMDTAKVCKMNGHKLQIFHEGFKNPIPAE